MAQVMKIEKLATPKSTDKKTYALNIKGLIAHLLDILFVGNKVEPKHTIIQLSSFIQRDIGLNR